MHVTDLGPIGLPLSAREAEVVKTRCSLARFGMGERTVIDRNVRDTWEIDASMVSIMFRGSLNKL